MRHQYVERTTGRVKTEKLFGDRLLRLIAPREHEDRHLLYRALTSQRITDFLAYVNFDSFLGSKLVGSMRFITSLGIDLAECLEAPATLDTPRKIFERRIRYWETRPMPSDPATIVAPADARMLVGSFAATSQVFLKDKFFGYEELLGYEKIQWIDAFRNGEYAVFRLTPEKYHYTHCPVSGMVRDIYVIDGVFAPCNPSVVVHLTSPLSKNRRVVTIIDTDVTDGSRVGMVAMIEITALMVGDIVQRYSESYYAHPRSVTPGMYFRKGQPKALFKPGSSTVVVVFQKDRVRFHTDILQNLYAGAASRFSEGLGRALVETEVTLRSGIAEACDLKVFSSDLRRVRTELRPVR